MATLALLSFAPFGRTVADELKTKAVAALFAADEDVLSENTDVVLHRASEMPIEQQFDYLAAWVLPSKTRSMFRMKATFVQTDPAPIVVASPAGSTIEGIRTPVFSLLAVAQQTNRMDELRRRVAAIDDPSEPHALRAKLALLFMVDSAIGKSESAAESLAALSALVRKRGENLDGRWWPETLALAYGMSNETSRLEMLDLATSIYDPQIGKSMWSGTTAWDVFIAGAYTKLSATVDNPTKSESTIRNDFEHWKPATVVTAKSRGGGCPTASWQAVGNSVRKIVGHNNDYLYFPSPLTGNFDIECDVTSFNYRETQLSFAGLFASHHWSLKEAEIGGFHNQLMLPLNPPMTSPDDWLSCRISVRDGECRHFLNGRMILKRTLTAGEYPWIALRSYRLGHGSIRNLTITGTPQVPDTVQMVTSPELVGWFSYFDEVIDDEDDSFSWRSVKTEQNTFEIQHRSAPEFAGCISENMLMYHRPMLEDGTIEYEFFYVPGQTIVHPAIDRLVFLLEPDGVKAHWVTDRQFQRDELPPDNRTHESQGELSLRVSDWNRLQFELKGDVVQIRLNGSTVVERRIEASNQRQFGLFHFADASSVRVRNIRWTGDWPKAADVSGILNESQNHTGEIERATAALPKTYQMKFQTLQNYRGHFVQRGGPIAIRNDGITTETVSLKGGQRTDLPLWLEVGGDFDLRATFQDFQHADTGDGGLELLAYLPENGQKIRIARHRWDNKEHKIRTRLSSITDAGQEKQRTVDHWSVNEATSGTFRIVRLGKVVYYMFAEGDSRIFRVLSTDEVGLGPLNSGGITLTAFSDKGGSASATWTSVSLRAEEISGVAVPDLLAIRDQLDAARDKLPTAVVHDFTTAPPNPEIFTRWTDLTPWNAKDKGLRIRAMGSDQWQASGLSAAIPMAGDFDICMEFDNLDLAVPGNGHQTTLGLEIEPGSRPETQIDSMLGLVPSGTIEAEGYARIRMPDGSLWYSGTERHVVKSATALRIARQGKRFFMLVRPSGETLDRIVSMSDNSDAAIRRIQVSLHTGGIGRESSVRLKSMKIFAEKYQSTINANE